LFPRDRTLLSMREGKRVFVLRFGWRLRGVLFTCLN
jgi:hypothetical protein